MNAALDSDGTAATQMQIMDCMTSAASGNRIAAAISTPAARATRIPSSEVERTVKDGNAAPVIVALSKAAQTPRIPAGRWAIQDVEAALRRDGGLWFASRTHPG